MKEKAATKAGSVLGPGPDRPHRRGRTREAATASPPDEPWEAILCVTPRGSLRIAYAKVRATPAGAVLDTEFRDALVDAFRAGEGPGLLLLATRPDPGVHHASLAVACGLVRLFFGNLCDQAEVLGVDQAPEMPTLALESLRELLASHPPMKGGEYLDDAALASAWTELDAAMRAAWQRSKRTLRRWLAGVHPDWDCVGRVCFHLAENREDPARPFAFLATYSRESSKGGRVRHAPLGKALLEYREDGEALRDLLQPVQQAAGSSEFLAELLRSREIFQPMAWRATEAYRFLQQVGACEQAGIRVRVPDWWRTRRQVARVEATVGKRKPSGLGLRGLLDFDLKVVLGGLELSSVEQQEILQGTSGLQLIKGGWVEVNADRLRQVLERFRHLERLARGRGVTFSEALRWLSGAPAAGVDAGSEELLRVTAGEWLDTTLQELLGREAAAGAADPGAEFRATLRPYQARGVEWMRLLTRLGMGAALADDMGLGKTIQVLALLLVLRREGNGGPHLLVLPASLLGNWKSELERFAPTLRFLVAHRSELPPAGWRKAASRLAEQDVVMTTYTTLGRTAWLQDAAWKLVILDEAQAIKNPGTRQSQAVKRLNCQARIALTGTPIENTLTDLWSLFDFLNPALLGGRQDFADWVAKMEEGARRDFGPLRRLVAPYILRRRKSDPSVAPDLPDKVEMRSFCGLSALQALQYREAVEEFAQKLAIQGDDAFQRGALILEYLLRLQQICNHPSHWLADGGFDPEDSGKFVRLREIAAEIRSRQEKALVFTRFRAMTGPLARFLGEIFGREGLVLDGKTAVGKRQALVDRFQDEDGPPFFVLSLKAGGVGLNLTAASHVIHFDRWWNPAVEDQATDRAYRIGQHRNVLVHLLLCRGTLEERIDRLLQNKRELATEVLALDGGRLLTEMSRTELLAVVALDARRAALSASVAHGGGA